MLKLLIVEDEDIIRKGLVLTIDWSGIGCTVAGEAKDGQEGYEKILKLKPDIVITDIRMPVMDGITMIEKARKEAEFEAVVLTSYAEFEYAQKSIALQVREYILKPIDEEHLLSVIANIGKDIHKKHKSAEIVRNAQSKEINLEYYAMMDRGENKYVSQTLDIIRNEYTGKLSLAEIADRLCVSASYLSRNFKEVTGQTFLEMLNKYRLQQAIKLINEGRYRLGEIADQVGFTDYKYFCEVFKKYINVSPRNFIKGQNI